MRKFYLVWMIVVFGIFGTVYGAYLLIYHFNHGNGLNIYALLLLILGAIALATILVLQIITLINKRKRKIETTLVEKAPSEEPVVEEVLAEETSSEEAVGQA